MNVKNTLVNILLGVVFLALAGGMIILAMDLVAWIATWIDYYKAYIMIGVIVIVAYFIGDFLRIELDRWGLI